jgi:hypothetical protein
MLDWENIRRLPGDESARVVSEALGITPDEARRRLSIAKYASWCADAFYEDWRGAFAKAMTDPATRKLYGKQMDEHDAQMCRRDMQRPFDDEGLEVR